jgi:glycosyltransferase involved in cell wall biosynthesis
VLFVPGKGDREFEAAMTALTASGFGPATVVTLGSERTRLDVPPGWRQVAVPTVRSERDLVTYYNAADIYVHCAYADNFPYTVLESLACGTPVVAYDVGGVPDMVRHGQTGYLARRGDPKDLAIGMRWLLRDEESRRVIAEQAREMCVAEFSVSRQARAYASLYSENLSRR